MLIGICTLVYFLDGVIHSILGPLAPEVSQSLNISKAQLGPIFSANLVGQCIGLVMLPLLGNRTGQRAIVLIAVIGFGIAQCATATANSATALFVWRLITGVFLGGCLPACLALVAAAAPAKRKGFIIMVLFTGYGLGATVAGLIATGFSGIGGWRMAMAVVGGACLVTAVVAWVWLREPAPRPAAAGITAADTNPLQIFSPRYIVGTLMLWLLFVSMLTISYCLNSWLPVLLVDVGRDQSFASLSVSIFSLGGIVSALGVGLLIDRLGAMQTLITFLTVATILLFIIGEVLASASGTALMLLLVACGFFVLGAYGGVNVVLASYYPDHLRAVGIGWTKSVGRIGTLIAPVLVGLGLSAGMQETTIMSLFAVPASIAILALSVIALVSRARQRPRAEAASPGN
jgi:MFS transporter, AAHS family, 4-hydroxybenzoate transporter